MKKFILGEFYEGDDGRNLVNCITSYLIKHDYKLYKISARKNALIKAIIILKSIFFNRKSELVLIYPATIVPGSSSVKSIILMLIFKISKIINLINNNVIKIIVIDMIIEQHDLKGNKRHFAKKAEKSLFDLSNYIFVPHKNYKEKINKKNLSKIKVFGIYREDMKLNTNYNNNKEAKIINVCMAGNLSKSRTYDVILKLPKCININYNFYGTCGEWINQLGRDDLKYHGTIEYSKLNEVLAENTCGLIAYSKNQHEYFKFALPAKLTTYINSKLPIITLNEYKTLAYFINKMNIGICMDKIEDILNLDIKSISNIQVNPELSTLESKYDVFIQ